MSWRLVYASAVGTSHISADLSCQDACQMQVAWLEDQQPLLSVFVADGAGSVSQGGEGAMLAVNEAMAYISQKVQGGELGLNDVLATDIVLT
ncbi:protein phosphatase 2C domain-containing protein, partial [Escherichia coli]|nr:protein phosphatase 2C domain-containing protein [Escherichia coli]